MKPYGNSYDSNKMKKAPWNGKPGVSKGRSPKKAARRQGKKLTEEDNLWLAVCRKIESLQRLRSPKSIRAYMEDGGFPEHLIQAYLKERGHHKP